MRADDGPRCRWGGSVWIRVESRAARIRYAVVSEFTLIYLFSYIDIYGAARRGT